MDERIRHGLLRAGIPDPPQVSRALGVLLFCGAILTALRLSLSDWEGANVVGLYGLGGAALILGGASVIWARHARTWTVHAVFATGTALICLGMYFAGVATGAYSVLFVWLVVMAASFFSGRAIAAHVVWILVGSAVAFAIIGDSPGVSPVTRWIFGSLLLVVAAAVMSQIAAGRRSVEEQLRMEIEEKARLQGELEHLAHHDPLTGLANRRRLDQELAGELARAARQDAPLCVVALDLNGFKEYNDVHGHVTGDRLLKLAASVWADALRDVDTIARVGGDEFVALLPDCPPADAERVMQRLSGSLPPGLTCSAGSALWDGRESAEELLSRADRAMYEAKKREPAEAARAPLGAGSAGVLPGPSL